MAKKTAPTKKETIKKTAKKATKTSPAKKTSSKPSTKKKVVAKKEIVKKVVSKKVSPIKNKKKTSLKVSTSSSTSSSSDYGMATSERLQLTQVKVMLNVGYGNTLYIRGEGNGLSWEKGTPMENPSENEWTWSKESEENLSPTIFKLLINDEFWSSGENFTVLSGETTIVNPTF